MSPEELAAVDKMAQYFLSQDPNATLGYVLSKFTKEVSELTADNERLKAALEDAEDSFEQIYADLGEQYFNPVWMIDEVVQPALKSVRLALTPQGTR